MKCIKCNEELEVDDNFCPTCGELTPHGYLSLKDNKLRYKENNIGSLFTLTSIIIISFITMTLISGKDMFRPYIELQKEISSLKYGYKVSIMNTNNKYTNVTLSTKEEAINLIKQDITKQSWKCKRNINVSLIEKEISESYNIPSVSLCDVDEDVSNKIKEVISTTYQLFPNIKGYLTNITITNAPSNEDYIAYFNPTNTFVNNNLDIKEYNKVNKTEILLNSYYFLNKDILSKGLKENWYPNNVSYESLIAHELGHYITFVTLLKQNNIDNITLVTKDNINSYQNILNILKKGTYSKDYDAAKTRVDAKITNTKEKYQQFKEERAQKAQDKKFQKQLEVKAEPVTSEPAAEVIQPSDNNIHNINYKKPVLEDQSLYTPIDIQKTRKNNLYGEFDNSRPPLREYNY